MLPLGALALVVAPVASAAPIVVAPASDVDALVESITGPGIEVVSSTLMVGSAATTGTFVGDGSDVDQEAALPFDSGVILGTGLVEGILGPNEGFYNGDGSGLDIDPEAGETCAVGAIPEGKEGVCDFDDGSGEGIFDATWLEIVFLPNQNELNLSYVFASDEYEEGAQARAGDALRILVNGQRCALTPSGSAVGSHTIHIGTPELFVDNTTSAYAIEANGLSTGLECEASVTPGVENTLKIGIANIGDGYNRDGYKWGHAHSSAFVGAFATAAIAVSAENVDLFSLRLREAAIDDGYFNSTLHALYLVTLSGGLGRPTCI